MKSYFIYSIPLFNEQHKIEIPFYFIKMLSTLQMDMNSSDRDGEMRKAID